MSSICLQHLHFQVEPKDPCVNALTKMSSCPACQGIPEIRPCPDYCVNVMKGCLAHHAELGDSWDKFIGEPVGNSCCNCLWKKSELILSFLPNSFPPSLSQLSVKNLGDKKSKTVQHYVKKHSYTQFFKGK